MMIDEGAYQFYIDNEPKRKLDETKLNKDNQIKRENNRKETIRNLNICVSKLKKENKELKERIKELKNELHEASSRNPRG